MSITNAITVDVEDYFQVSAFENSIDRNDWDSLEHRIVQNMNKTFEIFSRNSVKATFFVLGWIAERYPEIVKKIIENGHELASHGYGHQRVSDLTPVQFSEDIRRAKAILEDLSGQEVVGYRAPSYSIGEKNIWALQVLAEAGYQYSSSIYPIKHDHYGFPQAPRFAFREEKTGIIEIPISTLKINSRLFPAGGGGFFRFYPYFLSKWAIKKINQDDNEPVIFYFHPWELDANQPRQKNISIKSRFRHYLNLSSTETRLDRLLVDFDWGRVNDIFVNRAELKSYSLV
jgi:polysaccharide deacetylase family protein (PEP-CTERM system associated)